MIEARLFSEIFAEFEAAETKPAKQAVLQKYWHPALKMFFEYAFNPDVKFDVVPPKTWRPATEPAGLNVSYLDMEVSTICALVLAMKNLLKAISATNVLTSLNSKID